jgi:hypothetical protein
MSMIDTKLCFSNFAKTKGKPKKELKKEINEKKNIPHRYRKPVS